jgi:hypothetical protein
LAAQRIIERFIERDCAAAGFTAGDMGGDPGGFVARERAIAPGGNGCGRNAEGA